MISVCWKKNCIFTLSTTFGIATDSLRGNLWLPSCVVTVANPIIYGSGDTSHGSSVSTEIGYIESLWTC